MDLHFLCTVIFLIELIKNKYWFQDIMSNLWIVDIEILLNQMANKKV